MVLFSNQMFFGTATGSLMAFYDNVVYWEMAKGTNKFFVTFENGQYGVNNGRQESIGTCEIDYPRVNANTHSANNFSGVTRNNARFDAFMSSEEIIGPSSAQTHQYDGFIPMTQLKGGRFYESILTASFKNHAIRTYTYETFNADDNTVTAQKTVSCSYFYPKSQYQLSVLRDNPTIILDLGKETELPDGTGDKGVVIIPAETSYKVEQYIDWYLWKAGIREGNEPPRPPVDDRLPYSTRNKIGHLLHSDGDLGTGQGEGDQSDSDDVSLGGGDDSSTFY